jgi:hypothetical protein
VPGARRLRILELVVAAGASELETRRLCDVGAQLADASGAGIMLMAGDLRRGSLCATNQVSTLIEEQQFALGEGPCMDAYHHDRPVLEPNLADPREIRWPAFSGPVVAAGCRAVFAFPMRVGAVRLGALDLYRDRAGTLTDDQHADALVMADVAAEAVLALQAGAPPGQLAAELAAGADLHPVVHQASGMVAAQLEVSVAKALVRLRAYAFGHDLRLAVVARDVVELRLRFDPSDDDGTGPA